MIPSGGCSHSSSAVRQQPCIHVKNCNSKRNCNLYAKFETTETQSEKKLSISLGAWHETECKRFTKARNAQCAAQMSKAAACDFVLPAVAFLEAAQ